MGLKFYNTVYFKILIVVVILFLALLSIISVFFHLNRETLIAKEIEYIDALAEDIYNDFESSIQKSINAIYNIHISSSGIDLAHSGRYMDLFDQASAIADVGVQLEIAIGLNDYLSEISLFIPQINLTLTRESNQRYNVDDMDTSEYIALKDLIDDRNMLYIDNNIISILQTNLSFDTSNEIDKFLVKADFDNAAILDMLERLNVYEDASVILYTESAFEPIAMVGKGASTEGISLSYESETALVPTLDLYIPYSSILIDYDRTYRIFIFLLGMFVFLLVGYIVYCYIVVQKPMAEIIASIQHAQEGRFYRIDSKHKNTEFGMIADKLGEMTENLNEMIEHVYQKDLLVKRAELKQLQSQINPHFLYNNFFMLSRMIENEDNENAGYLLEHLGHYFRYITKEGRDEIELIKELEHAVNYLSIQTMRFQDRISYKVDKIPLRFEHLNVPRLILQPVVENIFKYSMENTDDPINIQITFSCHNNIIYIKIMDTISHIEPSKIAEINERFALKSLDDISGLTNIHRRIGIMYAAGSGLKIENLENSGLCVTITIDTATSVKEEDAL